MAGVVEIVVKATDKASSVLKKTTGGVKELSGGFKELGAALGITVSIGAVVGALKECIDAAAEAERVMTLTESVIKSTGGAAGYTAQQIANLAESESKLTSIDDEVIQSGLNMLLTFTKIGKDAFPLAARAVEDMAVAMAKGDTSMADLNGTAISVGKALNDFDGYTILKRQGVSFSEEQIKLIEHFKEIGDLASYQSMLLSELETEFGGAAAAAGGTFTGSLNKAKTSVGNLAEAIGKSLLPVLKDLMDVEITPFVDELTSNIDAWTQLKAAVDAGIISEDMALRVNYGMIEGLDTNARKMEWLTVVNQIYSDQINSTSEVEQIRIENLTGLKRATEEYIPTEEELAEAEEKAKEEAQKLNDEMSKLSTLMAGSLGDENKKYGEILLQIDEDQKDLQETIDETIDKIADLKAKYREADTKDQRKNIQDDIDQEKDKLGELIEKQEEYKQKIIDVANEHEEATKRILFGLLQQQLAIDGLTTEEGKALSEVAESWGLIDADTKLAWDRIQDYIGSLNGAKIKAGDLEKAIKGIPSEKNINLNVNTTFSSAFMSTMTPQQIAAATFHWGQQGIDTVVPPGYSEPNNPYIVAASSGEHVEVTPKGESSGSGGITINITGNKISSDVDIDEMAQKIAEVIKANQRRR